jgi:acyl carrier protein
MDDIYRRLTPIFHEVFEDDTIVLTPGLMASDVPDWDSLSHIRLVLAVQKAFQTQFSAAQIANLKTAGDLAELVRARMAAA